MNALRPRSLAVGSRPHDVSPQPRPLEPVGTAHITGLLASRRQRQPDWAVSYAGPPPPSTDRRAGQPFRKSGLKSRWNSAGTGAYRQYLDSAIFARRFGSSRT